MYKSLLLGLVGHIKLAKIYESIFMTRHLTLIFFRYAWVCFREVHYVLFTPVRASVVEWLSLIETGPADEDSQLRVGGNLGCSSLLET